MTYLSKRNLLNMIVGIALVLVYIFYAFSSAAPAIDDLKAWAVLLLIYIGLSIVVMIILQIVFHIIFSIIIAVHEKNEDGSKIEKIIKYTLLEDERNYLINLRSSHYSHILAGLGFIATLIALAFGLNAVIALHIVAGSFVVGSIIEGFVSICLNEEGMCDE